MPKRRRGFQPPHRAARATCRHGLQRAGRASAFESLVERALRAIPPPFDRALDEVAIVIADEPSREELAESGLDPDDVLYGLYEGTPRTEWGADLVPFPNKITLFRLPLEEDFPDPGELAEEVRETVIHELAHHLGIDDDRLHELGHE
jgi:predicted Zn-dependent protease with MMP-like domain